MVTEYIREYVKEECSKTGLTKELYDNHIVVVADYGARLARLLGADAMVVELASYLHDFSAVHNFEHLNDHAINGSKMAEELLRQFKFSDEIVNNVMDAILTHSKPINNKKSSVEAICLSNADAMSQLSKPIFWLYFGYAIKKRSYNECIKVYMKWMEDNWATMIQPARDMMQEEYAFVKTLKSK